MLIKKPADIHYSEVTPKHVDLNRRSFLAGIPADQWDAILTDHDGKLWIRSLHRLMVRAKGELHFTSRDLRLPPATISGSLQMDREGRLFVPTESGLSHLRNGAYESCLLHSSGSRRFDLGRAGGCGAGAMAWL